MHLAYGMEMRRDGLCFVYVTIKLRDMQELLRSLFDCLFLVDFRDL